MSLKRNTYPALLKCLTRTADSVAMPVDRFVALAIAEKIARVEHAAWLMQRRN